MRDPQFQQDWYTLAQQDPRVSIFQEPEFCLAWFDATDGLEEAILLTDRDPTSNALIGLMVLTQNFDTKKIQHAGAHQAIYDGWIATPEHQERFAEQAVELVFEQFELREWVWRYLPPGSPYEWAKREKPTQAPWISQISPYPLPRWDLGDEDFFKRKAKSKRLRNYANRYRKQGNLHLETVTDPKEAERLLKVLVDWVDFRQGAIHHTLPFRADPSKFDFYLGLVVAGRGTRMTALKLDDRPLAIQIDSVDEKNKTLSLCLHGYDPAEGQKSPGMILLSLLAQSLASEEYKLIDLTPGAKTWKDDFANDWYEGQRVELYGRYRSVAKQTGKRQFTNLARSFLRQAGIEPSEAKKQAKLLRSTLRHGPKTLQQKITGNQGVRLYRLEVSSSVSSIGPAIQSASVDPILAILELSERESKEDHGRLLFDALKRFERGAIAYAHATQSHASHHPLTHLSWLHLPPTKFVPPPPQEESALARPMLNLCEHFDFDAQKDALLVITYENDLDEDPVSVLTAAMTKVREMGLSDLYIAASPQHQATIRWLAARGIRIPLRNLTLEPSED